MWKARWLAVVVYVGLLSVGEAEVFEWGRSEQSGRGFSLRLTGGQITEFSAVVQETTRKLYEVTGETWKQERANNFDLDDFNISGSHPVFGLSMQRSGKFFTFMLDGTYIALSSEAVARRDYFLSVDSIIYDGVEYQHMMIPEGESFSFDVKGAALDMRLQLTPFTYRPVPSVGILPFLDAGLFGFFGRYDIEAGESRGVIQYQNPIENFVVGGKVDGLSGLGLPEIGGGLEMRFGPPEGVNLVLHGQYSFFTYKGGTSLFTSSSHREKKLDIDHRNIRLRLMGEFPLESGRSWMIGGQYQQVRSEGLVESASTDPEEIIARRERFDKEFSFRLTQVQALVGMTF